MPHPQIVPAPSYWTATKEARTNLAIGFKVLPALAKADKTEILKLLYADLAQQDAVREALKAGGDDPDAPERVLLYSPTNEGRDRDGDRIKVYGHNLTNFNANPVLLFNHLRGDLPAAKALRTWKERTGGPGGGARMLSLAAFPDAETYPFGFTVYKMAAGGFLKAASIGFIPQESKPDPELDEEERRSKYPWGGQLVSKTELLEWSLVTIPALPTALQAAKSAGINLAPYTEVLESALDADATPLARSFTAFASRDHLAKCWAAYQTARSFSAGDAADSDPDDGGRADLEDLGESEPEAQPTRDRDDPEPEAKSLPAPTAAETLAAAALLAEAGEKALEVLADAAKSIAGERDRVLSMLRKGQDLLAEAEDRALGTSDKDPPTDPPTLDPQPEPTAVPVLDFSSLINGGQ